MPGFISAVLLPNGAPKTPLRDAASLLLVRQDRDGCRVLMGVRNASHKFMPNRMVFPGGRVDPEDYHAPVAAPLRAPVLARLAQAAPTPLCHALGHAVARELAEETGLTLGDPPDLSGLHYLCRAETPPNSPIRFNARFFVADAGLARGIIAGSGELEVLDWVRMDEALARDLAPATRAVLGQLEAWLAVAPGLRDEWRAPVLKNRDWTFE